MTLMLIYIFKATDSSTFRFGKVGKILTDSTFPVHNSRANVFNTQTTPLFFCSDVEDSSARYKTRLISVRRRLRDKHRAKHDRYY